MRKELMLKKITNNLAYIIIGIVLAMAGVVLAVNVTVPKATSPGQVPIGNANGTYTPKATSTIGLMPLSTGVTGYIARWSSASNLSTSTLFDDGVKVGIGTAAPGFLLEVAGASSATTPLFNIKPGTGIVSDSALLAVNSRARFGYSGGFVTIDDANTSKQIMFFSGVIGQPARFTIAPSGNVTIGGGTTPTGLFSVVQPVLGVGTVTTASTTALVGSATQFTNTFKVGDSITVSGESVRTIATITDNLNLTVTVAFSTSASGLTYNTPGATAMTVLGNGNVGIGTVTPAQKLVIRGAAGNNDILNVANSSGTSVLYVASSGNVGIGTTTPDSKLDVNGFVRFESASSSLVTAAIGGAIVSGGCDSATTSVDSNLASSTTAFITTPVNDPGSTLGGTWAYSFLSSSGVITTRVCANITLTPVTTPYVVKIIR
jgi:hypothetical protein